DSKDMYEYLPATEEKEMVTLTVDQLKDMINNSQGIFEETLIRVFYDTGMRVSEIVSILWDDVVPNDDGGASIKVYGKGKGGMSKVRWVNVTNKTHHSMKKMKLSIPPKTGHVFVGERTKKGLTTRRIDQIVKNIAKRSGIEYIT